MNRRALLALPALLISVRGRAQPANRLPPDPPDTAPRNDGAFSAALLDGMARGEALAQERMKRFANLRVLRRQVPRRAHGSVESYYTQAFAVERRWDNAMVARPQGRAAYLPPDGWTDGTLVLVHVFAHPAQAEGGLLPYSLVTNMADA